MRGKVTDGGQRDVPPRITPAYAGKRHIEPLLAQFPRDHPCVCGEKLSLPRKARNHRGSPLRMRGKAYLSTPIPAYPTDHPCVCGEKCLSEGYQHGYLGSPLRMRGKVELKQSEADTRRITPAYAGKRGKNRLRKKR